MFRPILAIIRFSPERVLLFIRFMRLCNDGEIICGFSYYYYRVRQKELPYLRSE